MIVNSGMDFVTAERRLLFRIPSSETTPFALPASMFFYQPTFDRALRTVVSGQRTVEIQLGAEVRSVTSEADQIRVETMRDDGSKGELTVSWLVACDGAASTIREKAGIRRESFGFEEQWLVFDLKLRHPRPALPEMAVQVCDPARPHTELPMPGDRYRFEFMLLPGEDASQMMRADNAYQKLLAPRIPRGSAEIERTATYTFQALVAKSWRLGRILLAGDAAHLMPPFLGQGMCSGIRDATNLAWKLDQVITHGAPEALLDTYQTEREPHVRSIIRAGVTLGRLICTTDAHEAAVRDHRFLTDPAPEVERYRFRLPDLTPGPLILNGGGGLWIQTRAPISGKLLDDLVGQRFLILALDDSYLGSNVDWWTEVAGALVTKLHETHDPGGSLRAWLLQHEAGVVVVRPDRYVLGAGSNLDAITTQVRPWLTRSGAING